MNRTLIVAAYLLALGMAVAVFVLWPPRSPAIPIAEPRHQGSGISMAKWRDPANQAPKYQVLRILDQVEPSVGLGDAGVRRQLEELGFQIVDEDEIFRSDVGGIDIRHHDGREYGWNPGAPV